jgi:hypothetical protein
MRVKIPLAALGAAAAIVAAGCLGGGGAVQAPAQPGGQTAQAPAPPGGQTAQVVITGAVNKSYTPGDVGALKWSDSEVGIDLYQESPGQTGVVGCEVAIHFPLDSPPGTYAIQNQLERGAGAWGGGATLWASYWGDRCEDTDNSTFGYVSIGGTLVLTASGTSFSGSFEFDAVLAEDKTKKIHVSGTFQNVALP